MVETRHGAVVRGATFPHHREAQQDPLVADEAPRWTAGNRRKTNLLLLTSVLGVGGAETVIRDLVRHLDRDRLNVSVCCLKELGPTGAELAAEGLDIFSLPNSDPDRVDYFTAWQLRRILRDKQIDVVHSHTTHALFDAAVCRCLSDAVRVIHTFHYGNYPHQPGRTLLMEGISSRFADRLVAVGRVQREQVKQTFRLSDRAISTVHNGVQLPTANGADPTFRRDLGAEGKVLIGTISHLCPQKGLHDLLSVARRVRDDGQSAHFVVVGGGDMRAELEQRRRELGLETNVTFTGLLSSAASRALPSFDIYFQPSHWEAMSISLLEAMAAGKSIVTTDVGEAPHLIEQGVDGFLFAPGDVDGMAAAILALAQDERLRDATGKAAARKVAQRFTVDHMTRAYEKLYMDVLHTDTGDPASVRR